MIFSVIFPLVFPLLIIFIGRFVLSYFLIFFGFKVLKIEGIPKSKIIVYIIAMFLIGAVLDYIMPVVLKPIIGSLVLYSSYIVFAINFLISFIIVILFLKYYFLLAGKKLWQFLLYLILLNLFFNAIIVIIST